METTSAAQVEAERHRPELLAEQRRIGIDLKQIVDERRNLIAAIAKAGPAADTLMERLGDLDGTEAALKERLVAVHAELAAMETTAITANDVRDALQDFDALWAALLPREQQRLVRLLIAEIRFDADAAEVDIRFRPGGIHAVAEGRRQ